MKTSRRLAKLVLFNAREHPCNHTCTGIPDVITLPNLYSKCLVYELCRCLMAKADIIVMNTASFGFGIATGSETLYKYSCRKIGNRSARSWVWYI
jgi:hypothetical protein